MRRPLQILAIATACLPSILWAHPGGLNAEGCHNDRKHGTGYHCHRPAGAPGRAAAHASPFSSGLDDQGSRRPSGAFPNCAAARRAGAAPVRRGDPGYGPHLDADGDGIGCEPYRGRR